MGGPLGVFHVSITLVIPLLVEVAICWQKDHYAHTLSTTHRLAYPLSWSWLFIHLHTDWVKRIHIPLFGGSPSLSHVFAGLWLCSFHPHRELIFFPPHIIGLGIVPSFIVDHELKTAVVPSLNAGCSLLHALLTMFCFTMWHLLKIVVVFPYGSMLNCDCWLCLLPSRIIWESVPFSIF